MIFFPPLILIFIYNFSQEVICWMFSFRSVLGHENRKKMICLRFPFHDCMSATQEVLLSCGRLFPPASDFVQWLFWFSPPPLILPMTNEVSNHEGAGHIRRLRGDSEYTWLHQTSSRREKWGISGVKRTPENAKELGQTQARL